MRHVEQAWAGIDVGKGHHHVVVLDRDGTRLLSRRVANAETELITLIDSVTGWRRGCELGGRPGRRTSHAADHPAALFWVKETTSPRGGPPRARIPARGPAKNRPADP